MKQKYTAIIKNNGDWWIGWVEEIPGVNCQGKTKEELMKSLSITLREAIELNREDAIREAATNFNEEPVYA
jgi:predicted RNase H-like HicB family nuclease